MLLLILTICSIWYIWYHSKPCINHELKGSLIYLMYTNILVVSDPYPMNGNLIGLYMVMDKTGIIMGRTWQNGVPEIMFGMNQWYTLGFLDREGWYI